MACFDWRPSRAPKCTHCLQTHHVLLLPTSTFCLVTSSLNSVRRDPYVKRKLSTRAFQRALAQPGRGSRCPATWHTLSFCPLQFISPPPCAILNLCATNLNSEISLTFRFDWIASRVSRWACCLRTPHVLLLSHLDLSPCPLASCAPFGMLSTTSGSSQRLLSNTPTPELNDPRGHEQSTNPLKLAS